LHITSEFNEVAEGDLENRSATRFPLNSC